MNYVFPASVTNNGERSTVTAFNADSEEPLYTTTSDNPRWNDILDGLSVGDPEVWSLFDYGKGIAGKFIEITDRISYDGSNILFDGDVINSTLSDHMVRAVQEGDERNYVAVAKFWEKLQANPSESSREQAFDWLASHRFQINSEGDVVAFKGGLAAGDGKFVSTARSEARGKPSAYVNGNPIEPMSRVPYGVGDVVSMPRGEVVEDPRRSCSRGLHVGTADYSRSYGEQVVVTFSPTDLVSVPRDAGGEKVRVCKFKVISVGSEQTGEAVLHDNVWAGDVGYRV